MIIRTRARNAVLLTVMLVQCTMNNGSTHEVADTRQKRRATDNCTVENTSPTYSCAHTANLNISIFREALKRKLIKKLRDEETGTSWSHVTSA